MYLRRRGSSPEISPERLLPATLRIWRPARFPISGGSWPESELYCKNKARRSVHLESEWGMVPLKELERRLSLRSMRKSEIRSPSWPLSWRRGKRNSVTRSFLHETPRQSHGANGVDGSQPLSAPRGSWRLSFNDVKAWISVTEPHWAHDKKRAHNSTRMRKVGMVVMVVKKRRVRRYWSKARKKHRGVSANVRIFFSDSLKRTHRELEIPSLFSELCL